MRKCCFITLLFVGIAFIPQNASAQGTGTGLPPAPKPFTYKDEANWGNLDPSYKLCSTGAQQSPVNFIRNEAFLNKTLPRLTVDYNQITGGTLESDGLTPTMPIIGNSQLIVEGKPFTLRSCNWHVPAEHTIDDVRGAAEMQRVFIADDGGITIVSTLYRIAGPDPIIASLHDQILQVSRFVATGKGVRSAPISLERFQPDFFKLISNEKYYKYKGSLTSPPCTENVQWFVINDVQVITAKQVAEITTLQTKENLNNARPVKPLNGRPVEVADIKG